MSDQLDDLLHGLPSSKAVAPAEWELFSEGSGSLNIPRAAMPQIKSEHRGAMVQFLKGRGITHERLDVDPRALKASQAEYSPAKVERARGFEGPQRPVLVSADDHVIDGHHRWLGGMDKETIPAIRLNAPAQQLLIEAARFPSSGVDKASAIGAQSGAPALGGGQDELDDLLREVPAPKSRPAKAPARPAKPQAPVSTPAAPASAPGPARVRGLTEFVTSNGFELSPGRSGYATGGHNPGSPHYSGYAADVRTKDRTPEEVEEFIRRAEAAGFVVRDERTRPAGQAVWDGPHLHLEYDELGKALSDLPDAPELDALLADVPAVAGGEEAGDVIRVDSMYDHATADRQPAAGLPLLPSSPTPDIYTEEGRAARDAGRRLEAEPGARKVVDVRPEGVRDWSTLSSGDIAKLGFLQQAIERGNDPADVDAWLARNGGSFHIYDRATGQPLTTGEAMGREDIYDVNRRTFRLAAEMDKILKMEADINAGRSNIGRAYAWATDETRSPGEKFLDVVTPPAQFAVEKGGRALDIVTRPLQAIDAGFWSKVRGADDVLAVKTAYDQFFGDQPELGKNVIAEALRHSERLRAINPRLPDLLGELANLVLEPSNVIPVGALAKGAKALRGAEGAAELGRLGRLAERAGTGARDLGLVDRGLVESRPLGLFEHGGAPVPALDKGGDVGNVAREVLAPEAPETLASQMDALKSGRQRVVEVPANVVNNSGQKFVVPRDMRSFKTFDGGRVVYNPELVGRDEVVRAVDAGKLNELKAPAEPQQPVGAPELEAQVLAEAAASRAASALPVDESVFVRSPYYDMDPQEVLSAAVEGQRARLTELRRADAAAAQGVNPRTGAQLSPRQLRKLQGQVAELKAQVDAAPSLVRESFGEEAARAFEQRAAEGLPTEFTFDPRAGERGAVSVDLLTLGGGGKDLLLDLANVPRTLKASMDLSAPLRQGAIFTLTEPRAAARAMKAQLRAFVSEGNFEQTAREIAFHRDADLARRSGLYFATEEAAQPLAKGVTRPLGAREEAFMSRIAGSLPGVRHSERAYTTYLDKLRMEVFSKYADEIRSAASQAGREVDPKELRDIADFINKATGRGNIGDWGKTGAPLLNAGFFAPRYVASRFQILNPATYMRMSPVARRIAVRKMVQFSGTVGATMFLLKTSGADVDFTHPTDPDWLKVKFGDTRYDLTGGVRTEMRFLARFGDAVRRGLGGQKLGRTEEPGYILQRYVRSKLAPIPALAADAATGKTFTGESFSWKRGAVELVTPLILTDLYEAYQQEGTGGVVKTLPAGLGVGVQTYRKQEGGGGGRGVDGEPSERELERGP